MIKDLDNRMWYLDYVQKIDGFNKGGNMKWQVILASCIAFKGKDQVECEAFILCRWICGERIIENCISITTCNKMCYC